MQSRLVNEDGNTYLLKEFVHIFIHQIVTNVVFGKWGR